MAGMCNNPLIGDYTKGISRGPGYFKALDQRIMREKADPKVIVLDLQMGLFRDQARAVARSVSATGLGRFGPKVVLKNTSKIESKQQTKLPKLQCKKWEKVALQDLFVELKQRA